TEDNGIDNSVDIDQDGFINAAGASGIDFGNMAVDGSTVFDGDIGGLGGLDGLGGTGLNANSGIMDDSILGNGSAMFSNVGVGVNGSVDGASVNNNQTSVLNAVGQ